MLETSNLVCRRATRSTTKNAKFKAKGAWPRSRDLLLNLGTPSISVEWLKLRTSNLVYRRATRSTTKNAKLGTKGAWPRSHDLLLNFGTPQYLCNG